MSLFTSGWGLVQLSLKHHMFDFRRKVTPSAQDFDVIRQFKELSQCNLRHTSVKTIPAVHVSLDNGIITRTNGLVIEYRSTVILINN